MAGTELNLVKGTVDLNGANLHMLQVPVLPNRTALTLVDNDVADATLRTFDGMPEGYLYTIDKQLFRVRYATGTGNDVPLIRDGGGANLFTIRTNSPGLPFEFRAGELTMGIISSTH